MPPEEVLPADAVRFEGLIVSELRLRLVVANEPRRALAAPRLPSGVSELLKQWTDLALMVLTAEQHLKIAMLYECAAADRLGVPPQQRAAFARKAKWFRMKARIRAKTEAAAAPIETRQAEYSARPAADSRLGNGAAISSPVHAAAAAKPTYRSIAERLKAVRQAAQG